MTDHEILLELLEFKRNYERRRKIELIVHIVLIVILAAALIFAWVRISAMMNEVRANLDKVNSATQKVQDFFDGLKKAGIEHPEQAIQDLHEATVRLNEFFDRVGEKGMESLEQGIDAVEGAKDWLSGLFG